MRGVSVERGGNFSLARGLLVFEAEWEGEGARVAVYGRDGRLKDAIDSETWLDDLTLSRDGRRVALMKDAGEGQTGSGGFDVWTIDLDRKMFSRATFGTSDDDPVVSPDGTKIAFAHDGDLYVRAINGTGEPKLLVDSNADIVPCDWARDGTILYTDVETGTDDLFSVPESGGTPKRLTSTPFRELTPQVSPDGRWLAYTSNDGGDAQIYITRWPSLDGRWRVSKETAAMPRWGGDSRTLYFMSSDRKIYRATIEASGAEPTLALPEELLRTNYDGSYTARNYRWAVAPDGSTFYVLEAPPGHEARPSAISLVTNP
jgi:Tol biopolymer transport system component